MGRSYDHLSLEDRCEISRLQGNGCSIRQIAAALDRQPSTISRELKRNSGRSVGYKPSDVVRAGLRLLEEDEAKLEALRAALIEGEESGPAESFDLEDFLKRQRAKRDRTG